MIQILRTMPEECFGWFVAWASGSGIQFPEGLGGFQPDSRTAIEALRGEAQIYIDRTL